MLHLRKAGIFWTVVTETGKVVFRDFSRSLAEAYIQHNSDIIIRIIR